MILFLSAYPPRECGLASYSYQLIQALKEHFDSRSLSFEICALERGNEEKCLYPDEVRYTLNTADAAACKELARVINADQGIKAVCIQHRFGLWGGKRWGENILSFLEELEKPLAVVFHNVLPEPEQVLQRVVDTICRQAEVLITQTRHQAALLQQYYKVREEQVRIISPGAAVVPPFNKEALGKKHQLEEKFVISTFGLLRRSKGIEYMLEALDNIRLEYPEVVLLIMGKTHPAASYYEGERYRIQLKDLIFRKGLQKHVRFVNRDLKQDELQEYLCLSDAYLHNSRHSLSGLVQAIACGCEIISHPLATVEELLPNSARLVDLCQPAAIAATVTELAEKKRRFGDSAQKGQSHPYAWSNIALAYQEVITELVPIRIHYKLPELKADHLYSLTTSIGLQHADKYARIVTQPGYLLKDNAKALVAALLWYRQEPQQELLLLMLIRRFLNLIRKCQQPDGSFLSQLDDQGDYVPVYDKSLAEENSMQALWALSMLIKRHEHLPADLPNLAQRLFNKALPHVARLSSLNSIAFAIKALSQYNEVHRSEAVVAKIDKLAGQLLDAYSASATTEWPWFEQHLKPGSSLLPEALLLAWQLTGQAEYKKAAQRSFRFLLKQLFVMASPAAEPDDELPLMKEERFAFGDEPTEVCYTIMALDHFYQHTSDIDYLEKMYSAFSWFMGNNELHKSLYNPATGACYDGLRNGKLSQHQGAESLVSYLLSRITLDKYNKQFHTHHQQQQQEPVLPARKLKVIRGVEVIPDRASIPSGNVTVVAN